MSEIIAAQKVARPVVCRLLRRYPDDVDDVLQNAAIRALRSSAKFRGASKYSTWFTRIAIRMALMYLRSKASKIESSLISIETSRLDAFSKEETPEELATRLQREFLIRKRVHGAIRSLTPKRRLAVLRWMNGEKNSDGAEKAARHMARVQLRQRLR